MANEKRLIDASALMDKLEGLKSVLYGWEDYNTGVDSAVYKVENAPTVDAVEVVHGRWEKHSQSEEVYICSECCLNVADFEMRWLNYCPNCGAKMDGDGDG